MRSRDHSVKTTPRNPSSPNGPTRCDFCNWTLSDENHSIAGFGDHNLIDHHVRIRIAAVKAKAGYQQRSPRADVDLLRFSNAELTSASRPRARKPSSQPIMTDPGSTSRHLKWTFSTPKTDAAMSLACREFSPHQGLWRNWYSHKTSL